MNSGVRMIFCKKVIVVLIPSTWNSSSAASMRLIAWSRSDPWTISLA
jgi:hypothetical protein